jgi:hypothetical protein
VAVELAVELAVAVAVAVAVLVLLYALFLPSIYYQSHLYSLLV